MGTKTEEISGQQAQDVIKVLRGEAGGKKREKKQKTEKFIITNRFNPDTQRGVQVKEARSAVQGRYTPFCLVLYNSSTGVYCDPCKKKFCPMDLGKAEREKIPLVVAQRG